MSSVRTVHAVSTLHRVRMVHSVCMVVEAKCKAIYTVFEFIHVSEFVKAICTVCRFSNLTEFWSEDRRRPRHSGLPALIPHPAAAGEPSCPPGRPAGRAGAAAP